MKVAITIEPIKQITTLADVPPYRLCVTRSGKRYFRDGFGGMYEVSRWGHKCYHVDNVNSEIDYIEGPLQITALKPEGEGKAIVGEVKTLDDVEPYVVVKKEGSDTLYYWAPGPHSSPDRVMYASSGQGFNLACYIRKNIVISEIVGKLKVTVEE